MDSKVSLRIKAVQKAESFRSFTLIATSLDKNHRVSTVSKDDTGSPKKPKTPSEEAARETVKTTDCLQDVDESHETINRNPSLLLNGLRPVLKKPGLVSMAISSKRMM